MAGAKELLGNSQFGIIVNNSEEGIYEGMKMVLDSPALRTKYLDAIKMRASFVNLAERVAVIKAMIDAK